jgi:hypothetical protein
VDREFNIDPFELANKRLNIHGDAALIIGMVSYEQLNVTRAAVRKAGQWTATSIICSKIEASK